MRYWRDREVSDRLKQERADRKASREPNDTQLAGGIGFQWDADEYDD